MASFTPKLCRLSYGFLLFLTVWQAEAGGRCKGEWCRDSTVPNDGVRLYQVMSWSEEAGEALVTEETTVNSGEAVRLAMAQVRTCEQSCLVGSQWVPPSHRWRDAFICLPGPRARAPGPGARGPGRGPRPWDPTPAFTSRRAGKDLSKDGCSGPKSPAIYPAAKVTTAIVARPRNSEDTSLGALTTRIAAV